MGQSIYETAGGYATLLNLAETWHQLCTRDPATVHPFGLPGLHPQHTERLAAYLAEALGGPPLYSSEMGDETYMQALHAGKGEHAELDERALELWDEAIAMVGIPAEAGEQISTYFHWATRRMDRYMESEDLVPEALAIPEWTWEGPTRDGV
ncbi:MAG TPA: hypothetical protein VGL26_00180 [Jatrophihabitans sp.]